MPNQSLRPDNRDHICDARKEPVQPNEQHSVAARQFRPFRRLSTQDVQLMTKNDILGLQVFMRFETAPAVSQQYVYEACHRIDHDPILFAAAKPPDKVFGRHKA